MSLRWGEQLASFTDLWYHEADFSAGESFLWWGEIAFGHVRHRKFVVAQVDGLWHYLHRFLTLRGDPSWEPLNREPLGLRPGEKFAGGR